MFMDLICSLDDFAINSGASGALALPWAVGLARDSEGVDGAGGLEFLTMQ